MKRKLNLPSKQEQKKRKITDYFANNPKPLPKIFVGRIDRFKSSVTASKIGYKKIKIHTSPNGFGALSPYHVKTKEGYILENVWQFSKIYKKVRQVRLSKSRWQPNDIIWEWNSEIHLDDENKPTDDYWRWRQCGFKNKHPVRYPNSFHGRREVVCSIIKETLKRLNYVEARKEIYCKTYYECIKNHPQFLKLKKMRDEGENLLILDVDGPQFHDSFPYCLIKKGTLGDDGVGTIEINEQNVKEMLKNTNRPFGHGYVIATLLLNKDWILI